MSQAMPSVPDIKLIRTDTTLDPEWGWKSGWARSLRSWIPKRWEGWSILPEGWSILPIWGYSNVGNSTIQFLVVGVCVRAYPLQIPKKFELLILWILCSVYVFVQGRGYTLSSQYSLPWNVIILFIGTKWLTKWQFLTQWALSLDYLDRFRFSLGFEGGERGRRPPLPEIVRSSYRRLQ